MYRLKVKDQEQEFTLADFARLLRSRATLIIGSAIILGVFMTLVALAGSPVYEGRGSFMVTTTTGMSLSAASDYLSLLGGSPGINSEVEVVRSREIGRSVIDQLSLNIAISDVTYPNSIVKAINFVILDRLRRGIRTLRIAEANFPETSIGLNFFLHVTDESGGFRVTGPDGEIGTGRVGEPFVSGPISFTAAVISPTKGARFNLAPKHIEEALKSYLESLIVTSLGSANKSTNIIQIVYKANDPGLSSDVVNTLIDEYEARGREWKKTRGQAYSDLIQKRYEEATKTLAEAEAALENYQNEHGVVDLSEEAGIALSGISRREMELADIELRLSMFRDLKSDLESKIDSDEFTIPPSLAGDPLIQQLASDHARLMVEINDLLLDYTTGHPRVIAKMGAITSVRQNIIDVVNSTISGLTSRQSELSKLIGGMEIDLYRMPGVERQLVDLRRDRDVADEIYRMLGKKIEETALLEQSIEQGNRIIDRAVTPIKPTGPSIKRNLGIGVGLGFILGLLMAFLSYTLSRAIIEEQELYEFVQKQNVMTVDSSDSADIRRAAGLLTIALMKCDKKILSMVCPNSLSESAGAGLENIFSMIASSRNPLLLIDASSHPGERSFFDSPLSPGLSDISKDKPVDTITREEGRIKLIPPGDAPDSAMVASPLIAATLQSLAEKAEMTIIFASEMSADPALRGWAEFSSGVVLLVHKNKDLRRDIVSMVESIRAENVPILAAILFE